MDEEHPRKCVVPEDEPYGYEVSLGDFVRATKDAKKPEPEPQHESGQSPEITDSEQDTNYKGTYMVADLHDTPNLRFTQVQLKALAELCLFNSCHMAIGDTLDDYWDRVAATSDIHDIGLPRNEDGSPLTGLQVCLRMRSSINESLHKQRARKKALRRGVHVEESDFDLCMGLFIDKLNNGIRMLRAKASNKASNKATLTTVPPQLVDDFGAGRARDMRRQFTVKRDMLESEICQKGLEQSMPRLFADAVYGLSVRSKHRYLMSTTDDTLGALGRRKYY